jgi:hypothetical protein
MPSTVGTYYSTLDEVWRASTSEVTSDDLCYRIREIHAAHSDPAPAGGVYLATLLETLQKRPQRVRRPDGEAVWPEGSIAVSSLVRTPAP